MKPWITSGLTLLQTIRCGLAGGGGGCLSGDDFSLVFFIARAVPSPKLFFMTKRWLLILFFFIAFRSYADDTLSLSSPGHITELKIYHQPDGQIKYGVYYKQKFFIKPSGLGMKLSKPDALLNKFDILQTGNRDFDETWKPVWGEVSSIRNHYRELTLQLKDKSGSGVLLNIVFRAFDD